MQKFWHLRHAVALILLTSAGLQGCVSSKVLTLPSPTSPPAIADSGRVGLRVGFARVDITPPPGVSLTGDGLEAWQATGFRHRLYIRTMVLEDAAGERVALAVADLPLMSPVLHRRTAALALQNQTGIGADRLILSATHTHAGPGNYFGAEQYNQQAGGMPGFDPPFVDFLVDRMATSIAEAAKDLQPAVARWDTIHVRGLSWNRSLDAFERNVPPTLPPRPQRPLTPEELKVRQERAVDPVMTMLRVDRCDDGWSDCRPKGAYTVFAIHPTGYPAANRLLDGDILAIPERTLENRIEQDIRVRTNEPTSGGFHLFANGTEGDVAPRHFPGSRCEETLRQESGFGPAGPRRPSNPESWRSPPDRERECLEIARRSVNSIGDALAERAVTLFERIEKRGALSRDLRISRAFATYNLPGLGDEDTLCPEPRSGLAQVVGSTEDAGTRMIRWRFLGLIPSGMEEGGRAEDRSPSGCHQEKRILLGRLQGRFVGQYSFPEYAQLAVVRLGNTLLATLPWEVTTTVGWRMKEAIAAAGPRDVSRVVVVSVTNGYLSYLTTSEEYSAQHYEGGSNLYGPNTAAVLTRKLTDLAASLNTTSPIVEVDSMHVSPGFERRYFATRNRGRVPRARVFKSVECDRDGLTATWIDAGPGPLLPADGSILHVEERLGPPGESRVVAVDDHRSVEVRALRPAGDGHLWEVRWLPDEAPRGSHRVVLNDGDRRGEIFPGLASEWVDCEATSG